MPLFEITEKISFTNTEQPSETVTLSHLMDDEQSDELKYIAAMTVIQNEKRALNSFTNNNVRVNMRGQERQLLKGLNPFKLLSDKDKQHLFQASRQYLTSPTPPTS